MRECNFNKGLGPDGFDGTLLKVGSRKHQLTNNITRQLLAMLNEEVDIPEYLNEGRLVPLSKNKGSDQALLKDIRPIIVRSHLAKIVEKALMAKVESAAPHLLRTASYQTGFKEGTSTACNAARLLQLVHPGRSK